MPGKVDGPAGNPTRQGRRTAAGSLALLAAAVAGLAGCAPEDISTLTADKRILLPTSTIGTPSLPAGTSDWKVYDSGMVAINDPAAVAAMPVVSAKGGMRGTAYFDLLTVIEYRPDGSEVRPVVHDGLSSDTVQNWHSWSSAGGDEPENLVREPGGYQDNASLSVTDAGAAAAVVGWSNDRHLFKVTPGNQYRIRGFMRGQDITLLGEGTQIRFHLDVYARK